MCALLRRQNRGQACLYQNLHIIQKYYQTTSEKLKFDLDRGPQ